MLKWLKDKLYPWAYWHSQNLNERRVGDEVVKGAKWRAGRCWLRYGRREDPDRDIPRHEFSLEWYFLRRHISFGFSLSFEIEDGQGIKLHASIPWLASLYVSHSLPMRLLKRILPEHHYRHARMDGSVDMEGSYHVDRRIGVSTCGDWFQWSFWTHPDGGWYQLSDHPPLPWWREFSFFWKDKLLGSMQHKKEVLTPAHPVQIPMPEGCYPAMLTVERSTWKRPRWPFKIVRVTRDIECEYGVPFPGKGENSWDCGDDGLFGTGFEVDSDEQAVTRFAAAVLTNRRRYGGESCAREPWPEKPEDRIVRIQAQREARQDQSLQAAPKESQ